MNGDPLEPEGPLAPAHGDMRGNRHADSGSPDNDDSHPIIEYRGVRIRLDPAIVTARIREALEKGHYERAEAAKLGAIIKPGERILELGGGLGFISTMCARHKNTSEVLCYEANPHLIDFIAGTHRLNNVKVRVVNAALASGAGPAQMKFYLREAFWGSSLSPDNGPYVETTLVRRESFNEALSSFRPSLLIVDIEGGEADLFDDAEMDSVQRALVEIHTRVIGHRNVAKLFRRFADLGFVYDQKTSRGGVIGFVRIGRPHRGRRVFRAIRAAMGLSPP